MEPLSLQVFPQNNYDIERLQIMDELQAQEDLFI